VREEKRRRRDRRREMEADGWVPLVSERSDGKVKGVRWAAVAAGPMG
jgi:hypothetical protein